MTVSTFALRLKEASQQLKGYEAESQQLKAKLAQIEEENAALKKQSEAMKIAMQLVLDASTMQELTDKSASLETENLEVVKAAINLGLDSKTASLGKVSNRNNSAQKSPEQMFLEVLQS